MTDVDPDAARQVAHDALAMSCPEGAVTFGDFCLDLAAQELRRGAERIVLRAKTWAVLCYLIARAGKLVTKTELLDAVWPQTAVSDELPGISVRELRRALTDEARSPRFIETVHRRGYRFIATLHREFRAGRGYRDGESGAQHTIAVVGREREIAQLQRCLERALRGQRQVVFITGEAGIGKSTLVDAFQQLALATPALRATGLRVARGQCLYQFGAGESYLPILEALDRLCHQPHSDEHVALVRQHAPAWALRLRNVLSADDRQALERRAAAAPQGALHTQAVALEALATLAPLILILEDLHWCDQSTLDLLTRVAWREERAHLLILCTYRPVDVIIRRHPLHEVKHELVAHGRCRELALDFLNLDAVRAFLESYFSGAALPAGLAPWMHERTGGNPLFMVHVADDLVAQGVATLGADGRWRLSAHFDRVGVPESLRLMIEQRLQGLSPDARATLEAGSTVGLSFSVAAAAAALDANTLAVSDTCALLARTGQFIRAAGSEAWPDGTVAERYTFVHPLYREVLAAQLAPTRRARLHRRIGERMEAAYGHRVVEIAADLAVHFDAARDVQRTVDYHQQAAARSGPRESITHLRAALALLEPVGNDAAEAARVLLLRLRLATALIAAHGYAAPEVGENYERARLLCRSIEGGPLLVGVLAGLCAFHRSRAELGRARQVGEEALALAQKLDLPAALRGSVHGPLATALLYRGELHQAAATFTAGLPLLEQADFMQEYGPVAWVDPRATDRAHLAWVELLLGYPQRAGRTLDDALRRARALAHPFTLSVTLTLAGIVHGTRRDWPREQALAEEAIGIAKDQGFDLVQATATIVRGQALAEQRHERAGIAAMNTGLQTLRAMGATLANSGCLIALAAAHVRLGDLDTTHRLLDEALEHAAVSEERIAEAEIHRLRGVAHGAQAREGSSRRQHALQAAALCFRRALELARAQQAKWWELRAAVGWAALWRRGKRAEEAQQHLRAVYEWFAEGHDTQDLSDARALLACGARAQDSHSRGQ